MRTLYILSCFAFMFLLFSGGVFGQNNQTEPNECAQGCLLTMVGDGICESRCNVSACSFDKSDCIKNYTDCSPGCEISDLGNGVCDIPCATFQCLYDFGDCVGGNFSTQGNTGEECAQGCPISWLGDGTCDPTCNVESCQFDKGDCQSTTTTGNTQCAPGCPSVYIHDGVCDGACDVVQCSFDGGDCGGLAILNKNNSFIAQCQSFPSNLHFCKASSPSSNSIISQNACSNSDSNIISQFNSHKSSNNEEVQCYAAFADYQCGIGCVDCIPDSGILPVCRTVCTNFKTQCSKVSIPGIDVSALDCTSTLFSDSSCSQTAGVTLPSSSASNNNKGHFFVSALIGLFIFYLIM